MGGKRHCYAKHVFWKLTVCRCMVSNSLILVQPHSSPSRRIRSALLSGSQQLATTRGSGAELVDVFGCQLDDVPSSSSPSCTASRDGVTGSIELATLPGQLSFSQQATQVEHCWTCEESDTRSCKRVLHPQILQEHGIPTAHVRLVLPAGKCMLSQACR